MSKTTEIDGNRQKHTSDDVLSVFARLTPTQIRFAYACLEYPTKKDAALEIGIKPHTAYGWNGDVDIAIRLLTENVTGAALEIRRKNLVKAMLVKVALLDHPDANVRQKAATDIIEWEFGKADQPITHSHVVDWESDGDEV